MYDKKFFVYIMARECNSTFYIGVTADLIGRVWQHKNGYFEGFTKDHDIKTLVYYETHETWESAFQREKRLKKWNRPWKMRLIETINPEWKDLYDHLTSPDPRLRGDDEKRSVNNDIKNPFERV